MSFYKNQSKGFILLPMVLMLLTAVLILMSLTQHYYAHVLFSKELRYYLAAETTLIKSIPKVEQQLSHFTPAILAPQNQDILFDQVDDWPALTEQISAYSQLIQKNDDELTYSTLLIVHDNLAQIRLKYELTSACMLAERTCHPLQLVSM